VGRLWQGHGRQDDKLALDVKRHRFYRVHCLDKKMER
jgi:hypothetical protein